jgi:hypothetical protein
MSAPQAQPQSPPRPVVLAHGSLRNADFGDRVAAVAGALATATRQVLEAAGIPISPACR